MLLLHRRFAAAVRAAPRLWTAPLSTAASAATSHLPYNEALAVAGASVSSYVLLSRQRDLQFERLAPGVEAFHAATGHWIVPYHLPIPKASADGTLDSATTPRRKAWVVGRVREMSEIAWPRSTWGLNLGRVLDMFMKNPDYRIDYPGVVGELREIGFPVDADWREYSWEHQKFPALHIFRDIHGHSVVPIHFVVPHGDATTWPVCTWGFRLGKLVDNLRGNYETLTDDERADLESINFNTSASDAEWSELILPSIENFFKLYGHSIVKKSFVVPPTEEWPKRAWGFKLGLSVGTIRTRGAFTEQLERDADRLKAISFVWRVAEYRWSEIVLPSFELYDRIIGNLDDISYDFVVPAEAPWPEEAWELHLGAVVRNIRHKHYFAKQTARDAARLEELGFTWKLPGKEGKYRPKPRA